MLFFYLYLAHLISDYLLQPGTLVAWKKRSRWGIIMHATIHFLVTTLLAYIYTGSYYSIFLGLGIAACHFVIDCLKVDHINRSKHSYSAYWADQFAHFITIGIVYLIATRLPEFFSVKMVDWNNYFEAIYFSPIFITYSCLAIFSTLTIEYSFFLVKKGRGKTSSAQNTALSKRNMMKRLFLATLIYVGLLFSLVPSVGFNF